MGPPRSSCEETYRYSLNFSNRERSVVIIIVTLDRNHRNVLTDIDQRPPKGQRITRKKNRKTLSQDQKANGRKKVTNIVVSDTSSDSETGDVSEFPKRKPIPFEPRQTNMDQLAAAMAQLLHGQQRQQEQQQRQEEHQRQLMERQQQQEERQQELLERLANQNGEGKYKLKMAPYSNDDDIEDFLSQFEGKMQLGNVPEDEWVKYLVEVIAGKAREACRGINYTEATYDQMKEQLLSYFNIVPSSQLDRLKQYRWNDRLTPEEYVMKTEILLDRWLTPHEGIEQMREKLTIDRSLEGMSEPMRKWVREKEPKTKTEVITSMRVYLECHRRSERDVRSKNSFTKHSFQDYRRSSKNFQTGKPFIPKDRVKPEKDITCFKCHKKGHYARECRAETFVVQEIPVVKRTNECIGQIEDGKSVIMKIDTGCDRTTMRKTLVPERCLKNKFIKQELADGTMARRQLADVKIVIEGQTYKREVAVYEKLAAPVLLGQDLPLLQMLWNRSTIEERTKCLQSTGESGQLLAVTTRCQARQQEEAERQQQHEEETRDGGESSPLDIDDLSELEQQDERREETSEATSTMGSQGEVPQVEEMWSLEMTCLE